MTSSDRALIILGAGGHAAVVAEAAARAGWRVVGIASRDRPPTSGPFAGAEWLGDPDGVDAPTRVAAHVARGAMLHAAVGDSAARERWFAAFGGANAFATVVDPTAVVSPSAQIGRGVFLSTHAVVHARAAIGMGAIVNTAAVVEHDSAVGDFAHVSPGAILCGAVRVGRSAQVGAGAVVIPNRIIGEGATIGAGAVVIRDVEVGVTAVGVPAIARS
jgi:UDP-perosamine 4-acetyltransferase